MQSDFEITQARSEGRMTEKTVLKRLTAIVTVIVACLIAMSIIAYAYFSATISVQNTKMTSLSFEADISVTDANGDHVLPVSEQYKSSVFTLGAGEYTFTLSRSKSTANTGFCVVSVLGNDYHTQQLGKDAALGEELREKVSFVLSVTEETVVTVTSHHGTSALYNSENSEYYIVNSTPLRVIAATQTQTPPSEEEEGSSEEQAKENNGGGEEESSYDGSSEYIHIVQEGENLSKIAQKYGVDLGTLMAYNQDISDYNYILIGDEIRIPPLSWTPGAVSEEAAGEGEEDESDGEGAEDEAIE